MMSGNGNNKRTIAVNKRKMKKSNITITAMLQAGNRQAARFLNEVEMVAAANSADGATLEAAVTAAEDAGEVVKEFIKLLKSRRKVTKSQEKVGAYIAVIRPVMEYAAPVWHTGLTAELAESIESIQKRALRIIFGGNSFTISSYHSFCDSLAISSLYDRRDKLSADFYPQAVSITSYPIKDTAAK